MTCAPSDLQVQECGDMRYNMGHSPEDHVRWLKGIMS